MKNFGNVMKQAQQIQARMKELKDKLADMEQNGESGGGLVKVVITGRNDITQIHIDPSLLKADEKEMLEDLIVAAFADAKAKSEQRVSEEMKKITGGLNLPAGVDLGF